MSEVINNPANGEINEVCCPRLDRNCDVVFCCCCCVVSYVTHTHTHTPWENYDNFHRSVFCFCASSVRFCIAFCVFVRNLISGVEFTSDPIKGISSAGVCLRATNVYATAAVKFVGVIHLLSGIKLSLMLSHGRCKTIA